MKCEGCDYDWTGYEVCLKLNSISTCPECPGAGVEGHDSTIKSDTGSNASNG